MSDLTAKDLANLVWAFANAGHLDAGLFAALAKADEGSIDEFDEEDLPYNTFYGDGGRIDPGVVSHLNDAYDAELIKFRWQVDDVHLIDNVRMAHAREPYEGDRLILVALTEAFVPGA